MGFVEYIAPSLLIPISSPDFVVRDSILDADAQDIAKTFVDECILRSTLRMLSVATFHINTGEQRES